MPATHAATPVTEAQSPVTPSASARMCGLLTEIPEAPGPWDWTSLLAVLVLVALWAVLFHMTWATWGSLTVDSGREMYVPSILAQGKTLYRDIWYLYGPLGPYLNSFLFRLFGIRLEVLFWAGSLSALAAAMFLFLAGRQLSSRLAGWTAGTVVLVQAFEPGYFSFPLPYSFCAVYGCLAACMFLLFIVLAVQEPEKRLWVFAAGSAAAASMLLKPEFGAACYATLVGLIAVRSLQLWIWRDVLRDLVAVLPGVLLVVLVAGWMVSLRGVSFITQQNIASWPTSWFMRTYGARWLQNTGFGITKVLVADAALRISILAIVMFGFYHFLLWARQRLWLQLAGITPLTSGLAYLAVVRLRAADELARMIFFPKEMVLFVAIAAAFSWWFFLRRRPAKGSAAIPLVFTFSGVLAFRILLGAQPSGYAIFYDGPAVLSFLLLARLVIQRSSLLRHRSAQWGVLVCFGCLVAVSLHAVVVASRAGGLVELKTSRGSIRVSAHKAEAYRVAIAFMREKASRGESVLSVPEDTALYFLSETTCPTRVFAFTPGVVAPGKMTDELIQQLEQNRARYLLWSNREFPAYGVPVFGKDFDRVLGDYFRAHYHPLRPLVPARKAGWNAVIWERNGGEGSR